MAALYPASRSRTGIFGLYIIYERCPFFLTIFPLFKYVMKLDKVQFFKSSSFSFAYSPFFICFLIKKYKYIACILNQLELKPNIIVTLHNFHPLSHLVEQRDVFNDLQDQVTTKPITKLSLLCYF